MALQLTHIISRSDRPNRGHPPENCYLLHEIGGKSLLVDPGEHSEEILGRIEESRTKLVAILGTHGHYDHIAAVAEIQRALGVPFWLHSADEALLRQANLFRFAFGGSREVEIPVVNNYLDKQETLYFGLLRVVVIQTPGHTPGSVSFLCSGHLFSGDTLFCRSTGGSYLPGGSATALRSSLAKLATLPAETVLAPGHGPTSTLGEALCSPRVRAVLEGRVDPDREELEG